MSTLIRCSHLLRLHFSQPAPLQCRKKQLGGTMARNLSAQAQRVLKSLSIEPGSRVKGVYDSSGWREGSGSVIDSTEKATGQVMASIASASSEDVAQSLLRAREAYKAWRMVPAPKRGDILRQIRAKLADNIEPLGCLVSLEMGKIKSEGMGEVQEFIDIADFGVGLSRQLSGTILPSERPGHVLMEVCNPIGTVGIISAFNFPTAVFGWNFALSFVSGNATVWAPCATTPLVSIITTRIIASVLESNDVPVALALLCGGVDAGKALVASKDVDLVSFTGSEATGRQVASQVGSRLGKQILELGGNNAAICMPDADIDLAVRTVCFGAIGTSGQRCTSTRRLFLHETIAETFIDRLISAYNQIIPSRIGHPLSEGVLCGPVHTAQAKRKFEATLEQAVEQGGRIVFGGKAFQPSDSGLTGGHWVEPTVVFFEGHGETPPVMKEECFAPILHVKTFKTLEDAIALNNGVEQGLSSSIFTQDISNVFKWTGPEGSDCGIVNLNTSTSGAEIGGPFGGNKSTGWGRESGGDAWKQYSRWSTCVLNYSGELPLAQGVQFV